MGTFEACLDAFLAEWADADAKLASDLINAGGSCTLREAAYLAHKDRVEKARQKFCECVGYPPP